jgi:HlyD family secretion protein
VAGELKGRLLGRVRTLFDAGTATGLTDGQLLERFATRRDEGGELAFAALVERHGPMVLRVCRGVLRDDHEAMDAFQATFLVLARKGGSLWVRDSLGPWLHRVACRAAGRAKRAAARRLASERKAVEMAEIRHPGDGRDELASILHEEVDRLPERYRAAVVLCDLEGRTCEEAARHMGCPVGTVGSRLSRARQRLRDRLTRRGLASGALAWHGPREPLSPELVGATVAAAARFASSQAASTGAAALLAQGVLRSMIWTSWLKLATISLAVAASTSGVVSIAGKGRATVADEPPADAPQAPAAGDVSVVVAKPDTFKVVLTGRGNVSASRNNDVYCPIEGMSRIISLLPQGTRVKKGQLVCELDSSALRDRLVSQRTALLKSEGAYENAKLAREFAEIALKVYSEGVYPNEHAAAMGAVRMAEQAVKHAEERLKRTQTARTRLDATLAQGGTPKSPGDIIAVLDIEDRLAAAELAVPREQQSLETAQSKRNLLENFIKGKTIKELEIEIQKAQRSESAQRDARDRDRDQAQKLESKITACKLYAPNDGILILAIAILAEGDLVKERQKLFSVPDLDGPMQVEAKIHESVIDQARPGQTAQIKVDAFPNETFTGTVQVVAPLPDPTAMFEGAPKVYTTFVAIKNGIPGLRPGMTASVEITVETLEGVLSVPAQAVFQIKDTYHIAVKTPEGSVAWREVKLGATNSQAVVVKEGLKPGETVLVHPEATTVESLLQKGKPVPLPAYAPAPKPVSPNENKK